MTKLRKTIVVSVMGMMVLSMSAVVAPAASAAQAGDLIKMDGLSSVYFLAADGKRYVFPNENTYFSWYSDFSSVVTIPQSELEGIPLGKNVTIRPGTVLVKITTDPKVYAVEPNGDLVHIPDEATAMALYGENWAMRVVDVSDAFFTNYNVTGEQASDTAYPAGSLVKFGEEATVYYIAEDGMARPIADEAAFLANRFKFDDVISSSLTMPTEGSAISGAEEEITDTSSGAGGTAGAGSGLTVSLAGDTAASANIPSCSTLVPWATYNFTAANDGDVKINNLILTRKGAGPAGDFRGGYLFVGDERLTTRRSVNTSENTLTFTAVNLSIPAGMTKAVTLKMDAKGTSAACDDGTVGADERVQGNHFFQIASASDVETNGAVVSGSFPVAGNTLAYNTVEASDVTLSGQTGGGTFKVGETGRILSEFDISNGSEEVVHIYRIRLKQNGTAGDNALSGVSLDLDGTIVKENVMMEDKYIDFILDEPFELDKSKSITATVRGDIVGEIDKTLDFYGKNVADFDIRGSAFGNNYSANVIISGFTAASVTDINISGSEINVSFDGPQAQDIKDDTKDVVFANFKIMTNNLDVNVDSMRVVLNMTSDANDNPTNIEMVDDANGVSYSVADPSGASATHNLDFENIFLQAGVDYNFEIRGDIPDGVDSAQVYFVSIDFTDATATWDANFQDDDETAVDQADMSSLTLTGKNMSVSAPGVIFSKVTTSNATYVENADNVLLYKGKITANSVDDLKVSKVRVYTGAATTLANIGVAFNKLYLYKDNGDGTETLLDSETSLSGASNAAFSGFTLDIPKGTSNGVEVVVRGDVKDNPTTGALSLRWSIWSDVATTTAYTVRDSDNNALTVTSPTQYTISGTQGQTTTISGMGTFTMAIDTELSSLNSNQNVLAGTEVLVGRLKLTAANEAVTLEDFTLQNMNTATVDDVAYLRIYEEESLTTMLGEASFSSKRALFEDVNIEIPTAGITYLYVAAVVKPIDYSNSPGADSTATESRGVQLSIASSTGFTVKALGVSTGETLSNNNGIASTTATNLSTILGAVVTDVSTAFSNGILDTGLQDIFSFKVTVPDSLNIDFDGADLGAKIATTTFDFSISGATLSHGFKIQRTGGSAGEKDALENGGGATATSSGQFSVHFPTTYGSDTEPDLIIRPGDTAEYTVRGIVTSVDSNDSLKVTIENLDTNFKYLHNTGSNGTDQADTAAVSPLISGQTFVRGGTLTK